MPTSRSSLQRQTSRSVSSSQSNAQPPTKFPATSNQHQNQPSTKSDVIKVAIDLGSYSIRICIAKPDDDGKYIVKYPNVIVRTSQKRSFGAGSGLLTGTQIKQKCHNYGSLSLRQPMDRGMIVDWPTQKAILDLSIAEAFKAADIPANKNDRLLEGMEVIITESYFNLPDLQAGLDMLFLEGYGAAKLWRCSPALLVSHHSTLFSPNSVAIPRKRRRRPECMCIIDLGHSATHVVPIVNNSILWKSIRRHIISQRLLTNLLKETLSFRQWDMMDENWLIGHIKQECCFVASSAGRRGDIIDLQHDQPSDWSYAGMLEMCSDMPAYKNPLTVEYILPDYAASSTRGTLGYIKNTNIESRVTTLSEFIIRSKSSTSHQANRKQVEIEEGSSDESDDDFQEDTSEPSPSKPRRKKKRKSLTTQITQTKEQEEDMQQILILERERFQVPEVMFDPGMIGLDDAPLPQVIDDSIRSCDEDIQGLLWSNIVLVGGGANMMGLKQRLINELQCRAPIGIPLHIYTAEHTSLTAIQGAQALLTESSRTLTDRFIPAQEYSPQLVHDKFDTWSNIPSPAFST